VRAGREQQQRQEEKEEEEENAHLRWRVFLGVLRLERFGVADYIRSITTKNRRVSSFENEWTKGHCHILLISF
jgi:hypothetical protein